MKRSPVARAERYRSFARLFLVEPDAETLQALRDVPRFTEASRINPRDLRVEFTRLFGMNVFPYASVFLDPEALLNTATTARVEAKYAAADFEPARDLPIGAPDHFGVELSFVAQLLSSGRAGAANQFLESELLSWAVVFLHAVEKNAHVDFYRILACETRRWLLEEFDSSSCGEDLQRRNSHSEFALQGNEEDDLFSVVSFLVTPAQSGIFLSKEDLSRIGRHLELPMSFGDRGLMLKSLFRSAGEYEKIDPLLVTLNAEVDDWIELYSSDSENHPAVAVALRPWRVRAEETLTRLEKMERASQAAG